MKIAIIGAGYVGLTSAACFAEFGVYVKCIDKVQEKIEGLNECKVPFFEPGLEELVKKNTKNGRLTFTTDMTGAIKEAEVVFIAVGTPPRDDGSSDMQYVESAAREIGRCLNSYKVIVTKSTVPVGTGDWIRELIKEELTSDIEFDVASNPEFLREGAAIDDFMRPNRVVIGASGERAREIMRALYKPLYLIETPFVMTDVRTAELIKYAANCFLATKISFINEMANLCDTLKADVHTVAKAVGLDGRIGSKFLHPGPGFGGSCFPKDLQALIHIGREAGNDMKIIGAASEVNNNQWKRMVDKVIDALGGEKYINGKIIAMLGLSYKPKTDDVRESPALKIASALIAKGVKVRAHDPEAMDNALRVVPELELADDAYEAAHGADLLLLVTEWNEFRNLDMERIKELLNEPTFVDLRNVYEPDRMEQMGFKYVSVGRAS